MDGLQEFNRMLSKKVYFLGSVIFCIFYSTAFALLNTPVINLSFEMMAINRALVYALFGVVNAIGIFLCLNYVFTKFGFFNLYATLSSFVGIVLLTVSVALPYAPQGTALYIVRRVLIGLSIGCYGFAYILFILHTIKRNKAFLIATALCALLCCVSGILVAVVGCWAIFELIPIWVIFITFTLFAFLPLFEVGMIDGEEEVSGDKNYVSAEDDFDSFVKGEEDNTSDIESEEEKEESEISQEEGPEGEE